MVGVFVRDDDGIDVLAARQVGRQRARVDDQAAAFVLNDKAGVLELRDLHRLSIAHFATLKR